MARKKRKQIKPECWWCDRPGASNEDVVPLWVGRMYPNPANWIHENAHPELGHFKVKKARRPSVKSRKFCQQCNNGWMAKLEEEVIPVIKPMMFGEPTRLSEIDQRLLALWICKTIFAFQTIQPQEMRFIPRELYKQLYIDKEPPLGTQIWLGTRDAGKSVAWHRAHSLDKENGAGYGFGSTLAFGALVAHLIWHDEPKQKLVISREMKSALIQIWPVRKAHRLWPPFRPIGGRDLSWFAQEVVAGSRLGQA